MITLTTEQAQQIEEIVEHLLVDHPTARHHKACVEALSIIRAARAQEQAEQEPVAEVVLHSHKVGFGRTEERKDIVFLADVEVGTNLYAAPIHTKDLTAVEILAVARGIGIVFDESDKEQQIDDIQVFARAVITADREKNK